jgi:uncharacterized protein YkwD
VPLQLSSFRPLALATVSLLAAGTLASVWTRIDAGSANTTDSVPTVSLDMAGAGKSQAASGAAGSGTASGGQQLLRASSKPGTTPVQLGTVHGDVTLAGPAKAPSGTRVTFTLRGPAKKSLTDTTAPFRVRVSTTTLPNGPYSFTMRIVRGAASTTRLARLTILNPSAGSSGQTGTPGQSGTTGQASTGQNGMTGQAGTTQAGGRSAVQPSDNAAVAAARTRPRRRSAASTTTSAPSTSSAAPTVTPTRTATSTPPADTPTTSTVTGGVGQTASFAAEVVRLTNEQRLSNGCKALTVNAVLTDVAQAHSQDMADNNYFSHQTQDGKSPFDRMSAAGYTYSLAAENIAAGQPTPAAVVQAWMKSPGHRDNIVNCGLREIGVGYATGGSYGMYWVQDFGTSR